MADFGVSTRALEGIINNGARPNRPRFQILDARVIYPNSRLRVVLSDGVTNHEYVMLRAPATQEGLPKFKLAVIELVDYDLVVSNCNKKVLIITEFVMVHEGPSVGRTAIINNGAHPVRPRFQILDAKVINANSRLRVNLSDGVTKFEYTMVATPATQEDLPKFKLAVIELLDYVLSDSKDKKILIVSNFAMIHEGPTVGKMIGHASSIAPTVSHTPNMNTSMPQQPHFNPLMASGGVKRPANGMPMQNGESPKRGPAVSRVNGQMNMVPQQPTFPGSGQSPARARGQMSSGPQDTEGFEKDGPAPQNICPIPMLSQYQNRWTIKAQVQSKEDIRTWTNAKGEGKVGSVWLSDGQGEIKASLFTSEIEKYWNLLQEGKTYYIRGATIKDADPRYNRGLRQCMNFRSDTLIRLAEDNAAIPEVPLHFKKISELTTLDLGVNFDMCCVVKDIQEMFQGTSKAGREYKKRDVDVMDDSQCSIRLTLWGRLAEEFSAQVGDVIVVKGCQVGEYNGSRNVGTAIGATLRVNPDINDVYLLQGWYTQNAGNVEIRQISGSGPSANVPFMTIEDADAETVARPEQPIGFQLKATIMRPGSDRRAPVYRACQEQRVVGTNRDGSQRVQPCNKKIPDGGDDVCTTCNVHGGKVAYRYMLSAEINDFTGHKYVTLFDDQAEKLLQMKGEEMHQLYSTDATAAAKVMDKLRFESFIFKMRTKTDFYQDQQQVKWNVNEVHPLDYTKYTKQLVEMYKQLQV